MDAGVCVCVHAWMQHIHICVQEYGAWACMSAWVCLKACKGSEGNCVCIWLSVSDYLCLHLHIYCTYPYNLNITYNLEIDIY